MNEINDDQTEDWVDDDMKENGKLRMKSMHDTLAWFP